MAVDEETKKVLKEIVKELLAELETEKPKPAPAEPKKAEIANDDVELTEEEWAEIEAMLKPQPKKEKCPECGVELEYGVKHCPNCGVKLEWE